MYSYLHAPTNADIIVALFSAHLSGSLPDGLSKALVKAIDDSNVTHIKVTVCSPRNLTIISLVVVSMYVGNMSRTFRCSRCLPISD